MDLSADRGSTSGERPVDPQFRGAPRYRSPSSEIKLTPAEDSKQSQNRMQTRSFKMMGSGMDVRREIVVWLESKIPP